MLSVEENKREKGSAQEEDVGVVNNMAAIQQAAERDGQDCHKTHMARSDSSFLKKNIYKKKIKLHSTAVQLIFNHVIHSQSFLGPDRLPVISTLKVFACVCVCIAPHKFGNGHGTQTMDN